VHLSRLLYFGSLLFLGSPYIVPLYALPGHPVPDAETCKSILSRLNNPTIETLEAATQLLLPAEEAFLREAIRRMELRFRHNQVNRDETHRIFAALLRKTVSHALRDLPRARDVTAAVLLGSVSVEQIEKILQQVRRPDGWDNPDLVSHLGVTEETIHSWKGPVRLLPTPDSKAPYYGGLRFVDPTTLGLPEVPEFSPSVFKVRKSKLETEIQQYTIATQIELALALEVSQEEWIVAVGTDQMRAISWASKSISGQSANILSVSFPTRENPTFHVRECKSRWRPFMEIGQIEATVNALLKLIPQIEFGDLELVFPEGERDRVPNDYKPSFKSVQADGSEVEYFVEVRFISVPEPAVDDAGFCIPPSYKPQAGGQVLYPAVGDSF
jgi:hypothetical protein